MTTRIAVCLPGDQVAAIRHAVEDGDAPPVSGFISEAIARGQREDSLQSLLDDLDDELGAPTGADYDWAGSALGLR